MTPTAARSCTRCLPWPATSGSRSWPKVSSPQSRSSTCARSAATLPRATSTRGRWRATASSTTSICRRLLATTSFLLTEFDLMNYETILVTRRERVGLITLNRPQALNALNDRLMDELGSALLEFDKDDGIGAIVVTGNEKAFAAGADIGAMKDWTHMDVFKGEYISRNW